VRNGRTVLIVAVSRGGQGNPVLQELDCWVTDPDSFQLRPLEDRTASSLTLLSITRSQTTPLFYTELESQKVNLTQPAGESKR